MDSHSPRKPTIGHNVAFKPQAQTSNGGTQRINEMQAEVDKVVEIMKVNVEKVMERDHKLAQLDDRADALQEGAARFNTAAASLRRKYWWKNMKLVVVLMLVFIVLMIIAIFYAIKP